MYKGIHLSRIPLICKIISADEEKPANFVFVNKVSYPCLSLFHAFYLLLFPFVSSLKLALLGLSNNPPNQIIP
jgi:hypothetical protein